MNTKIDINYNWKSEYDKFIDYLFSLQDLKYRDFQANIGINNNVIGVRMPILKQIAKKISKGSYQDFIKYNKHQYYEEIMIHGLIIGYLKDYSEVLIEFNKFIPYINNWAICDTICSNMKIINNNLDKTYPLILSYLYDNEIYVKRVGIVLLNNYYINDQYIDDIIVEFSKIAANDYYVKMALAWLISSCYIKYPIKVIDFLRFNKLDDWTHNKAIQKIRESLKVSSDEKVKLNLLKRGSNNG